VQGLVHAADPDVFEADDAPCVDPRQYLDGVAGPGGDLGGEGGGADFLPDLPPGGRLEPAIMYML
jgi:hypothetical protein